MSIRLGEIDVNKRVVKPRLSLCKPNKESISNMNEAYDINYSQKLGALNEITFKIPFYKDKHHKLERNRNADIIRGRYLIRLVLGRLEEYFIINQLEKISNDEEFIEVKALNLGFELNDKIIRDFEIQSKTATELLNSILIDTIWSVGYVDSEFDLKYRGLDVSSSTVLELVFDIAQTFNALVVWDSLNRTVNLYRPDAVGEDKGFKIKYGKYLESLNEEDNSEEVITRLKMYGKEDISIREVNPTGTPYIEDFSYFISPYEETLSYSERVDQALDIYTSWQRNNSSNWAYDESNDVVKLNSTQSLYSTIVNPNSSTDKNYKVSSIFRAISGDGKLGYVVRYQDDDNHYIVQWEQGSPNPILKQLNEELEAKKSERDEISSNLNVERDNLFILETQKIILQDEKSIIEELIFDKENLIAYKKAIGENTSTLENELSQLEDDLTDKINEISENQSDINDSNNRISTLENDLKQIRIDITNLEVQIKVEETNPVNARLRVLKRKDGDLSTIKEAHYIDGWDLDVPYKLSVEAHNEYITVFIDNRLVLSCRDSDFEHGTYGVFGNGLRFQFSDIDFEGKEYVVNSRSEYMSDDLCHYLLQYDRLLQKKKDEFETILGVKEQFDDLYAIKLDELSHLNIQLKILLDERDILNTRIAQVEDQIDHADNTFQDKSMYESNLHGLQNDLSVKLMEISAKENDIRIKENELLNVSLDLDSQMKKINDLKVLLAVENNFRPELLDERNQYIIEKEWSNNNIEDPKDLLQEGINVFNELKEQKITLSINLVNFLGMIEEQRNWDKLVLGDTFKIEHERLRVKFTAKLTEVDYKFEDSSINVKISNVKDMYTNKDKFLEMLYSSYGTSTTVDMDKWKWDLSMENKGSINDIINNIWDANRQAIMGAKDQVIEISDRGLIIRDPNDPNNYLVGLNSMIAITNDGGQTWKHAITSTGIVGERSKYGNIHIDNDLYI